MKSRVLLMLIFALLISCSSDDSNDTNGLDIPFKKLKTYSQTSNNYPKVEYHFLYENNLITKSAILDYGEYSYATYEYNSLNKVSKILYYRINQNTNELDFNNPANFNEVNSVVDLEYLNGNLISQAIQNEFTIYYDYNSNNDLTRIYCDPCEDIDIFYDNGNISAITYSYGGDSSTSTHEFDDRINPFYALFKKYGITIRKIDDHRNDFYYKNNVSRSFRNGELNYSASHQYNSEGYPTTVNFQNITLGRGGSGVFLYE